MSINVDKCSVMHIGHNNMQSKHNMSDQQLPTTDQRSDLGIIITKGLKWDKTNREKPQNDQQITGVHYRQMSGTKTKN